MADSYHYTSYSMISPPPHKPRTNPSHLKFLLPCILSQQWEKNCGCLRERPPKVLAFEHLLPSWWHYLRSPEGAESSSWDSVLSRLCVCTKRWTFSAPCSCLVPATRCHASWPWWTLMSMEPRAQIKPYLHFLGHGVLSLQQRSNWYRNQHGESNWFSTCGFRPFHRGHLRLSRNHRLWNSNKNNVMIED